MSSGNEPSGYDVFLSHGTPDKPWVRSLADHLTQAGLRVYLEERELQPADNWVAGLNAGVQYSRFLVLVLTQQTLERPWVETEWTSHLAFHGPSGRLIPVLLEDVRLPPFLSAVQAIKAKHRDANQVAQELLRRIGRPGEIPAGDARQLYIGQDLVFVLRCDGDRLTVTDPAGRTHTVEPPRHGDPRYTVARLGFDRLTRTPLASDTERAELTQHATALGELLFGVLFDESALELLRQAALPGGPPPVLTIRSDDDGLLALPWELLHHDGAFLVRDARLDLARTTLNEVHAAALPRPAAEYFRLVVNVSAPQGSGLNYEGESYRITRALSEHCRLVPTELGTLEDLVETVNRVRPSGVHFSGHGGPGKLVFEDNEGGADAVAVADLVSQLRQRLPGALPPFFYLASCHGNDPAAPESEKAESSAARLHREGVAQVVGYYGPIADVLSTQAEVALYAAIADGQTTRYAVRQARAALARPLRSDDGKYRPDVREEGERSRAASGAVASSHPFAWAQLVFYQRGPDHPLSKAPPPDVRRQLDEELQRTWEDRGGRKVLATGFVGRRTDLHRVRRRLREGDRVFVFQGLGGLGKTTLAFQVLPLLGSAEDICALWCQEVEQEKDPAEALVLKLLTYCRTRFGLDWNAVEQQVDRQAGDDPVARFAYYLGALLQNVPRLVLYLDNLESLLVGPGGSLEEGVFGTWKSPALAGLWGLLRQAAKQTAKLYVVASCRYQNEDFGGALVPVSPLPLDALYRLMGWFSALRRLARPTRARLVSRLAGHPRAVEYTDDLIAHQLAQWKRRHGAWRLPDVPAEADLEREWAQLVESALPGVDQQLRDDLLFDALWEHVLDERARRMLYRMTVLRRPWTWELMVHLGESNEGPEPALETAERLARTSLLEQIELSIGLHYTVHPATVQFVQAQHGAEPALLRETHCRVGDYLEVQAKTSRYIDIDIEAGHHLFQAEEYNRAYELLGPASDWLQNHGRVREGLRLLEPFLEEVVRQALWPELVGRLLGTVGVAYARLGQVDKAIGCFEQRLAIAREIGDRHGEGKALGNLGLAYADLGQVDKAIGYYEQQLEITREIGDRRGEGNALGNLGLAYARLGQVDKAIGCYEQHLAIAREIGDRHGEGAALGNMGAAYARLGQVDKAIGCYEQALVIDREIGDRYGEESALGNLGAAYARLGQVDKAIGCHEQALVIDREIGDRRGEGADLGNLGLAYAALGQVDKAIGYLEQALRIGNEIKDPYLIEIASKNLARLRGDGGS